MTSYPHVQQLAPYLGHDISEGGELWHLWRAACAESLFFFTKAVVCHDVPPSLNVMTYRTHGAIARLLEHTEISHALIEYPRKHLKSTMASMAYPIWRLVNRVAAQEDPYDRWAIISGTAKLAQRHWLDCKGIFDENKFFQMLFPDLEINHDKGWNQSVGYLKRAWDRKDPTFEALSKKSAGKHYEGIICDDLIDEENYDSPDAVENAITLFRMANNLIEKEGDQLIVVGNRWGLNDLNTHIHNIAVEGNWAVLSVNTETGANWGGEFSCVNLPDDVMADLDLIHQTALSEKCIWPERITPSYLKKLRVELGPAIYAAQYLNQPDDPEATDFNTEQLKSCRFEMDDQGNPGVWFFPENDWVPFSQMNLYVTWDPALDGKSSKSENAVVVTFTAPPREGKKRMRVGVLKEHARKESPRKSLDKFMAFLRAFKGYIHSSGIEEVLFQKVLKDLIQDKADEHHIFTGLRKLKTPRNQSKDQRIRAWLGDYIERGYFYVEENCPKTLRQIKLFGVEGAPRDIIDAVAYGTQLWDTPMTEEEKAFEWEMEDMAIWSAGPTGYGSSLAI